MHVSLVQVDVIVGPLQGAEFQYLVLGNMGTLLRAFSGLFAACGRLHVASLSASPLRCAAPHSRRYASSRFMHAARAHASLAAQAPMLRAYPCASLGNLDTHGAAVSMLP